MARLDRAIGSGTRGAIREELAVRATVCLKSPCRAEPDGPIPPHVDLEGLARETKAFQRPRGVRFGTDLMRLALAWGPGGYSMQQVVAWAGEIRIAGRGYANAPAWQRFLQAGGGQTGFIVRMRWNTVRLTDTVGELFDLVT